MDEFTNKLDALRDILYWVIFLKFHHLFSPMLVHSNIYIYIYILVVVVAKFYMVRKYYFKLTTHMS